MAESGAADGGAVNDPRGPKVTHPYNSTTVTTASRELIRVDLMWAPSASCFWKGVMKNIP